MTIKEGGSPGVGSKKGIPRGEKVATKRGEGTTKLSTYESYGVLLLKN